MKRKEREMINTPYGFETRLSDRDFQKIGQFACRWALIEHTIANCLRRLVDLTPKEAEIVIFPLGLSERMKRIKKLIKCHGLPSYHTTVFAS
jgi:hypothetical protein